LVGTGLFHLLPESIELVGASTGMAILVGFAVFYLPQKFVLTHPCDDEECDFHRLGLLAFFGIAFHALTDGVGIGAVGDKPELVIVSFAVMMHKVPASVALVSMLIGSGYARKSSFFFLTIFSVATPLGAIITTYLAGADNSYLLGMATGFSVGNFLAIAGSDLLRRLHEREAKGKLIRIGAVGLGCLLAFIV